MSAAEALIVVVALLAVLCAVAALAGWLGSVLERRRPPMARRVRRQVLPPPARHCERRYTDVHPIGRAQL